MDDLTATGERLDPGAHPRTHDEHAHLERYLWASRHSRGNVLDIACGTGYGTAILSAAPATATVTGIEKLPEAANRAAAAAPSASIIAAAVPPVPMDDSSVDTVICMETIEHIQDDSGLVRELRRVLCDGGELFLSTPNAVVTSPAGAILNAWHVREYRLPELLSLVTENGFENVEVFAQQIRLEGRLNVVARKILARFPSLCRPERWWDRIGHGSCRIEPWRDRGTPVFWVIRCS